MSSFPRSLVLLLIAAYALTFTVGCSSVASDTAQASQNSGLNSGSGSSGSGSSGSGSSGSGSSGSGSSGSGSSGSGSSGSGSSGSGSGSSGSGSSGSGSSGSGSSGSGSSGSGSSGSGSSGSGSSGSGSSGSGSSGSGSSGSGSSGSGSSGSGSSGSGSSGSGSSTGSGEGGLSVVPANAVASSSLQTLTTWKEAYDTGTSGSSTGAMSVVTLPSLSGQARQFVTTYTDEGGERYWVSFGSDPSATNFLYDAWVYLPNSASGIDTLELDMNQVIADGDTIIYGFQCDGNSHTWDYNENAGSPVQYSDHWIRSTQPCNVRTWAADTWHHVQVWYSRDGNNVTYHSVWLDGTEQDIDATVPSAFTLGWGPVLLTNFQVDGQGASGSSTAYVDNLTVYRW